MRMQPVWDWSMRIFHTAFALSLAAALVIAFTVDDDSPVFRYHMLFGLTAGFLLAVRLAVAITGNRHARLTRLLFRPSETIRYLFLAPLGKAARYTAHNPGTALAALLMFGLTAGLVWTGVSMGTDGAEDLHEALAYGLIAAIGMHLAGLILHTLYHRDPIALGMITGRKLVADSEPPAPTRPLAGAACLLLLGLWTAGLFNGYDAGAGNVQLPLIGTVQLGEHEQEYRSSGDDHGRYHDDDDDDD